MEAGCKVREGDGRQSRKAVGTWAEFGFFLVMLCVLQDLISSTRD